MYEKHTKCALLRGSSLDIYMSPQCVRRPTECRLHTSESSLKQSKNSSLPYEESEPLKLTLGLSIESIFVKA